jgi:hypothetical protein
MTLVANTLKTIIRLVPHEEISNDMWQMIKSVFPFCETLNENTHVFDGALYTNKSGQSRYLIAALPVSVAENLTREGAEKAGSIHKINRLDIIENMYFQKYTALCDSQKSLLIIFSQENGYRLLQITDKLPHAAFTFSDHPVHRETELLRILHHVSAEGLAAVLLTENNKDFGWIAEILHKNNIYETLF